ncbi:hypothetical protein, partial [Candidatus Methanodesulfokora washburnensis]
IIILVIAVALALLIFSPISGYIFGSLGRTSTVGGASQIQVLSVYNSGNSVAIDIKNLGPGTITKSSGDINGSDFKVFIDNNEVKVSGTTPSSIHAWNVSSVITITIQQNYDTAFATKQHSIVIYGPGNTQTQYLFSPQG